MIECVINVSEGRATGLIEQIGAAAGDALLDVHSDRDHNRSVYTLADPEAARPLTEVAISILDLRSHAGVHPRIGVVDVVPFVPMGNSTMEQVLTERDAFGRWAARSLGVPGFSYGPERSLPTVRRSAFGDLAPTWGPLEPHPTAGAIAIGARPVMVAYNLWLKAGSSLDEARIAARSIRSGYVRALGLQVGSEVQVSMNLIAPDVMGPAEVWDEVERTCHIERAELVGLIPQSVIDTVAANRRAQLDLEGERSVESKAHSAGWL